MTANEVITFMKTRFRDGHLVGALREDEDRFLEKIFDLVSRDFAKSYLLSSTLRLADDNY
ncbi:hypothetical protein HYU92_00475 [Candidatus Curtissbacteria bacterium]|nr:hypothetical protein [Candidatus Curtissbacteria bacterium]